MEYLFELETELTCVSLEKEAGLAEGDIARLTIYPEGAVKIETKTALPVATQDKLKASLAKRNLPRGKKPVEIGG